MAILDLRNGKTHLVATVYRATEFLEEGRFAEVYRAHYKRDGVDVALKVYKEAVTSAKADDRARKECELLKKLADLEFFPARPSCFAEHFDRKRHHVVVMELGEYRWEEGEEGVGVSVSREVAACERVLTEAGLKINLHAYGTNIEGEWDDVFAAIKRCHEVVHAMGAPRVSSSLRFGTRIDRDQTMDDKMRSVKEKLIVG